jgi:hypothetical protein
MINQMAVMIVNVVTDAPELGHGDTDERPNPDPSATRTSVSEIAATAPPRTAAHATPELAASSDGLSSA